MSKLGANERLASVAREQLGLFTRAQARAAGFTDNQLAHARSTGRFEDFGTAVMRVAGAPESWEQRLWAACLETGGVASHRSAGWLFLLDGLGRRPFEPPEVLVRFENRRRSDRATVRRARGLEPDHLWKGKGLPRTNLARTLIDLATVLDAGHLELAFDSALRRQADLRHWVQRLVRRMPGNGRRGLQHLKELLADGAPALDSPLEVKLRRLLRRARLPPAREGVDVVFEGTHVAKLDFAWPSNDPPVALMAHGLRFHGNTARWRRDLEQVTELSSLGWRVVQCTHDEVEHGAGQLVERLLRALRGYHARTEVGTVVQLDC